jgi:ribosomal protein S18 acetylase RimI-like enzyme
MSTSAVSSPVVQALSVDQWEVLRDARLESLKDAGVGREGALGGSYDDESLRSNSAWRRQFDGNDWFVVRDRGEVVGLAALNRAGYYIESLWVKPAFRKRGVARTLVDTVARAVPKNLPYVELWVFATNALAVLAFERMGFEEVPGSAKTFLGTGQPEFRMRRSRSTPATR